MNRFEMFLILVVLAICAIGSARAATPSPMGPVPIGGCVSIQHNGVEAFKASSVDYSSLVWNFTTGDECGITPPPTPGFAPNAVTYQQLKYITTTPRNAPLNNVPVRNYANVAGRNNSLAAPVDFSYTPGSTWQMPGIRGDQVWQTVITVPSDSPLGHLWSFKGVQYGYGVGVGTLRSSPYPIDVQVFEVDGRTGVFQPLPGPTGVGVRSGSLKTSVLMNDNRIIFFIVGDSANQSFVPILPGHTYVLQVKWSSLPAASRGDFMFAWVG